MRKKILTCIITGCLALAMATGAMAQQKEQVDVYDQAKNKVKSVVFIEGRSEYFVNGQTPGVKMDVAPYIVQGRTFVPIRFLANSLGVNNDHIAWDTATSKAKLTLGKNSAELTIGKKEIVANGIPLKTDVAPELKNSRTFLPARFVAEALGYQVDFINGLVVCYPEGTDKPVADILAIQQLIGQQVEQGQQSTVDVSQVGKPVAGQPWDEWVLRAGKYTTITPEDLKISDYKLSENITIKDILINKDTIEVTLNATTPIFSILLVDDEGYLRPRDAGSRDPQENRKFTYKVLNPNMDGNYPPAEISKIKSIIIGCVGNTLEVINPYYAGGGK